MFIISNRSINLNAIKEPIRKDVMQALRKVISLCNPNSDAGRAVKNLYDRILADNKEKFSSHLYSRSRHSAMKVPEVAPKYNEDSPSLNGYEILNKFFDMTFANNPAVFAFGEDLGKGGTAKPDK